MIKFEKVTPNVHLVSSDLKTPWKCNGLLIRSDNGRSVMIDCNFNDEELKSLFEFAGGKPERYYITHVHVDHVLNVYRIEAHDIPLFCPENEVRYIKNVELLIEDSGASKYGVIEEMKLFLYSFAGFRNIESAKPYKKNDSFIFDNIEISSVHLPGHSPGHSGFIIKDLNLKNRPVLFSTDMGIEKIGAWYGFDYCNVTDIRKSLMKIENIYNGDDYILTGSHCDIFSEKDSGIFREVEKKIDRSQMKILSLMDGRDFTSPDNLIFKGVFYRTSSIDKMDEFQKGLYYFWEGCTIRNLFEDLHHQGLIEKNGDDSWILNQEKSQDHYFRNNLKEVFGS